METLDYGNTSDNIYNSIKHTGNTLTILPLDNDIISTQWHKYNRDLNYQWKKKPGIGQHVMVYRRW